MAPKVTKKEKEKRTAKKAEEMAADALTEDAPTDSPADGPTDNDKPDEELLYDAEGALMKLKAGTSAEARAALATTDFGDSREAEGSPRCRRRRCSRGRRGSWPCRPGCVPSQRRRG
jgi:hypothetical protein